MLSLENPSIFAKSVLSKIAIYTIYINNIAEDSEDLIIMISDYLKDYTNIFSNNTARALPKYRGTNYIIDLMPEKEPPFGPIYNLSEKELQVL